MTIERFILGRSAAAGVRTQGPLAFPEEAVHGRFHGLGPASLALFVAGTPAQHALATQGAAVLGDLGVPCCVRNPADGRPGPHDLVLPGPVTADAPEPDLISAIVPFPCLAREVGRRRGWPPERMRYPDLSRRLRITLGGAG
jgi:hypothetical protein